MECSYALNNDVTLNLLQIANRWKDDYGFEHANQSPLASAIFTAFIFWLRRRGMNSTKAIGIIIVAYRGLSFIGKCLLGMGA